MLALSTFPPLKKERVEIAGFLRQILLVSGELARERGIDFRSEVQENLPPLWLDADRMKEVLINLTPNAAHSTPPGGTVTLRALKNNGRVVIQVADTGGGIPSRDREKIFLPLDQSFFLDGHLLPDSSGGHRFPFFLGNPWAVGALCPDPSVPSASFHFHEEDGFQRNTQEFGQRPDDKKLKNPQPG